MDLKSNQRIIDFIFIIILIGCSPASDLPTPAMIGEKERIRVIAGKQAVRVVDKLHGQSVATTANVIAEYGRD
jgi:hypothetical protein